MNVIFHFCQLILLNPKHWTFKSLMTHVYLIGTTYHLITVALFTQRSCFRAATESLLYCAFAFLLRTKQRRHHAAPACRHLAIKRGVWLWHLTQQRWPLAWRKTGRQHFINNNNHLPSLLYGEWSWPLLGQLVAHRPHGFPNLWTVSTALLLPWVSC